MRFGVHLPTYWDDYGANSMDVAIAETAKAAAALGYEGVWANDLVITPAADRETAINEQVIEPLVTLASLVHLVPRLTLGTAVLVLPQRHPILVAKQAAALHLLSGGRLVLGVGIGHRAAEFAQLGADFAHRAAATDEAIELMRALWREPVANFQGKFHRLDAVCMPPHPPDGGPPIWVGGNSPAAIRRAAKYGSGWLSFVHDLDPFANDLDDFRSGVALLHELTREKRCPTVANEFYLRIERPDEPTTVQSTTSGMMSAFAGSPDDVAEHFDAYRRAGVEYALCVFQAEGLDDLLRQMHVFAEQVAPHVTDGG
jgi:probable F420-dependent oxidoreductase